MSKLRHTNRGYSDSFSGAGVEKIMLMYRRTNILESTAQTLVNTVNCVGAMGKGLAHDFKELYPEMFEGYKKICDKDLLKPGKLWIWPAADHLILNFPTKIHWRNPSKIEWVEQGLAKFVSVYKKLGVREISFPRLGCGNGGLDWNDVRPLMERYLSELPIPVYIHDFTKDIGLPEHLEAVATQLKDNHLRDDTFDTFFDTLRRVISISDGDLVELGSNCRFDASIDSDELRITSKAGEWKYESDDLLGVWYRLRKGLVTADDADWSGRGGGRPLLSMLSLMPGVRPVEIQRRNTTTAEIAVELRPNAARSANAAAPRDQIELSWH